GSRAELLEGKPGPAPIATAAQLPQLAEDAGLVLVLPFPDATDQFLTSQVVPRLAFLLAQPALDDGLRGNPGMIGAWYPQGVVTLHAPPANQDVLKRVIQGMSHVQRPGHVGRRDDDAKRLALSVGVAMKVAAAF